ncbi:MAG TPA: type II toxin-antitoxin system VapC family toxin [Rhizomicrobium sp.]|jgi:predicted nucleic acid-binding protein
MIVIDTSVIVKFVIPEVRSDAAARLRGNVLAAPAIWQAEVGNAFWRKIQTKQFDEKRALPLLRALFNGIVATIGTDEDNVREALKIAAALEHPIYDCFFLEAAVRENTFVVTDDNRFGEVVRRNKKWTSHLRLLSEF